MKHCAVIYVYTVIVKYAKKHNLCLLLSVFNRYVEAQLTLMTITNPPLPVL